MKFLIAGFAFAGSNFATNMPHRPGRFYWRGKTIICYEHVIRPGEFHIVVNRVADGDCDL
jgi:hypothetical protein